MSDTTALKTLIRNVSGGTINLSFIGNGLELAANEEYSFYGSLAEAVTRGKGESRALRALAALDALLTQATPSIEVIYGPAAILYDATDDMTKQLQMVNGGLQAATPSWLASRFSSSL